MIYFRTTDGKHVVILEPANVQKMILGVNSVTPDGEVAIAFTPDGEWTEAELTKIWNSGTKLDPEQFHRILAEGMKRKTITR